MRPSRFPAITIIESTGSFRYIYPNKTDSELIDYAYLLTSLHEVGDVYDSSGNVVIEYATKRKDLVETLAKSRKERILRRLRPGVRKDHGEKDKPARAIGPNLPRPERVGPKKKGNSDPRKGRGRRKIRSEAVDFILRNCGGEIDISDVRDKGALKKVVDGLISVSVGGWRQEGDMIINESGRLFPLRDFPISGDRIVGSHHIDRDWLLKLRSCLMEAVAIEEPPVTAEKPVISDIIEQVWNKNRDLMISRNITDPAMLVGAVWRKFGDQGWEPIYELYDRDPAKFERNVLASINA